jgi:hypothetical protein
MSRLSENSVLAIKNKSHAITAEVEIPDGGSAEGVILRPIHLARRADADRDGAPMTYPIQIQRNKRSTK